MSDSSSDSGSRQELSDNIDIDLVEDPGRLATSLAATDEPAVGVDVERANGQRYFRIAALVQVGVPGSCVLLDALALPDLSGLDRFLHGRLAVLHALENDVDSLEDSGVHLTEVADTAVAAGLLGLPLGLDSLLDAVLDVSPAGDKKRMQRADWTRRPLPDEMMTYAAGDVVHLPALWGRLEERLVAAGRLDWYEQELAHTLRTARDAERSWTQTKGVARLDDRGRAVLRSLWQARERLGRELDLAPQVVARDDLLVAAAERGAGSVDDLRELGLRRDQLRHADELLAAVGRGEHAPPESVPDDGRPLTPEDRDAHDRMRRARSRVAGEIDLDPGVLCPSRVLRDAVAADPDSPAALCEAAGLRPWQRDLLADALWDAYAGEAATD